jgi:hypothetical protein
LVWRAKCPHGPRRRDDRQQRQIEKAEEGEEKIMRVIHRVTTLSLGIALGLAVSGSAAEKSGRLSGTVLGVDKNASEIMLQQGTAHRTVIFSGATKFTAGSAANSQTNNPASVDDVKAGNYLTCEGTWNAVKLAATACTVRPSKRP